MKMIDADAIRYEPMLSARGNGQYVDVMVAYKDQIDDMPAIEERKTGRAVYQAGYAEGYKAAQLERKTGKWLPYLSEGLTVKCSECGSRFDRPWHHCPNCGSAMEGVQYGI